VSAGRSAGRRHGDRRWARARHPRFRVLVSLLLLDVWPARGPAARRRAIPRLHAAGLRWLDLQPRGRSRPPPARLLLAGGLVTVLRDGPRRAPPPLPAPPPPARRGA